MKRRHLLQASALIAVPQAWAASDSPQKAIASVGNYPNKPVTWICPYAAGGNADSRSRQVAKAMGANIRATSGPTIEKAGDLAGLLTNLEEGDVLFIDEIHRLQKTIEEYLYPAMEDFKLDIIIDQGPNARSVRLNLPRFTLIGATTRSGLLSAPLLTRFGMRERLDYYDAAQLQKIVLRAARLLNVEMEEAGAMEIARRSRGTPRIANRLLRRVRDYAQVKGDGVITREVARG